MTEDHDIWTAEDVAKYLRISKKTVYNMYASGTLPGFKLCNTLRFLRSRIVSLAEGC